MNRSLLSPPYRLALSYAPRRAQAATLGLLALDQRLRGIVRAAREPVLAQLKLAWWRDRLGEPPAGWPKGEPLLALLASWGDDVRELAGLVDGWEALLLEGTTADLIAGRGQAAAALARVLGVPAAAGLAEQTGQLWSEADFAPLPEGDRQLPHLPKPLRALSVLAKLSMTSDQSKLLQFLAVMRIGLFGR